MTPPAKEVGVARVVLTIDPGNIDPKLMANAARLAQAYDAELVGLFVKIQDFINLAELPFTRTVVAPTGQIKPLEKLDMEKILDDKASRAEKSLSEQAARRNLRWSFQAHTGYAEDIVADHTTGRDIVSLSGAAALTIRKVAERHQHPAMVITQRGLEGNQPVIVVYEGQAATLSVGRQIASSLGVEMSVLVASEQEADQTRYRTNARAWLRRNDTSADVDILDQGDHESLLRRMAASRPGLVVLSSDGPIGTLLLRQLEREEPSSPLLLIGGQS